MKFKRLLGWKASLQSQARNIPGNNDSKIVQVTLSDEAQAALKEKGPPTAVENPAKGFPAKTSGISGADVALTLLTSPAKAEQHQTANSSDYQQDNGNSRDPIAGEAGRPYQPGAVASKRV